VPVGVSGEAARGPAPAKEQAVYLTERAALCTGGTREQRSGG
jgi:hypothetical protein